MCITQAKIIDHFKLECEKELVDVGIELCQVVTGGPEEKALATARDLMWWPGMMASPSVLGILDLATLPLPLLSSSAVMVVKAS